MKLKRSYCSSILIPVLSVLVGLSSYGQGNDIEKTYRWNRAVSAQGNITFINYDCPLQIHTWDKAEIAYELSVHASLRSEEDAMKLDGFIENLDFSKMPGGIRFDNRFWSSRKAIRNRKTMTLKGEGTIRYSEFNMKGEIWIPEDSRLTLHSKYSEIEAPDLNGELTLDLYNDRFYGGQVNSKMNLKAKYSTLEFKDMKDIEADLYNADVEAGNIGDLQIQSKYSTIRAGDAGRADIHAYNDKYTFGHAGDIRFVDKYSDLVAESTGNLELDCYNSTLTVQKAEAVELRSKYGKYEIGTLPGLHILAGYNDTYEIDKLSVLDIDESKYGVYKIEFLERSLKLKEGYSDKFTISGSGALEELELNGKYIEAEMTLDKDLSYLFRADVRFADFDFPEESLQVRRQIKDGSSLEMEAVKGVEKEGMPVFSVNGYEMSVKLRDMR